MFIKRTSRTFVRCLLAGLPALVFVLSGCADDAGPGDPGGDTPTPNPDPTPDPDPTPGVEPLFALGAWDNPTMTSFVKFASSLGTDGKIDESKTIETVTSGALYGNDMAHEFFIADAATGSIIKYKVADDGTVTEDASVSFGAFGVNTFSFPVIQIASATKAYLWDDVTFKAFVWDPSTMTIVKDVDLSDQFDNEQDGVDYTTFRERLSTQTGGKIYTAFHYYNFVDRVLPYSGVLVIDTEQDEFSVIKHSSCPGFHNSLLGEDGYIYFASGAHASATYMAGIPGQATPCLARLDIETGQWDESYDINLLELTEGRAAGGLIHNEGTFGYMKILNEELLPPDTPMDTPRALINANAWEMYRFDVRDPAATLTRVDVPAAGSTITSVAADGRRYMSLIDWVNNKTTLLDVTKNPPAPTFAVDGVISAAVRVK